MTLAELVAETLVQKHLRLMREKCRHLEVYSSTCVGPHGTFTNDVCLDCGQSWHRSHAETSPERRLRCQRCFLLLDQCGCGRGAEQANKS